MNEEQKGFDYLKLLTTPPVPIFPEGKETLLAVIHNKKTIFAIKPNGDIILNDKVLHNCKELAGVIKTIVPTPVEDGTIGHYYGYRFELSDNHKEQGQ